MYIKFCFVTRIWFDCTFRCLYSFVFHCYMILDLFELKGCCYCLLGTHDRPLKVYSRRRSRSESKKELNAVAKKNLSSSHFELRIGKMRYANFSPSYFVYRAPTSLHTSLALLINSCTLQRLLWRLEVGYIIGCESVMLINFGDKWEVPAFWIYICTFGVLMRLLWCLFQQEAFKI